MTVYVVSYFDRHRDIYVYRHFCASDDDGAYTAANSMIVPGNWRITSISERYDGRFVWKAERGVEAA